jgi:hypothetical protein
MIEGSIHASPASAAEAEPERPGAPESSRLEQPTTSTPATAFGGLRIAELAALDTEKLALLATLGC